MEQSEQTLASIAEVLVRLSKKLPPLAAPPPLSEQPAVNVLDNDILVTTR